MASKKIAGVVVALGIVGVLVLLPVFMYGPTVSASEATIQLQLSSPGSGSISTNQFGGFSASILNVSHTEKSISAYEYAMTKVGGIARVSQPGQGGPPSGIVSITITLTLSTPGGQNVTMNLTPGRLEGTGVQEISVLLGPDELNRESGEFQITITITIIVTPPVGPGIELNLTPVSNNFTVPA